MKSVNVHEAKTHLSRLLRRVARGEEIVIAKAGKPVARLVPISPHGGIDAILGIDKGRIWISDDFTGPLPDGILDAFEGATEDPS